MDIGTILAVLTGIVVLGILGWQAATGVLAGASQRATAPTTVATRPDLRPLPRHLRLVGGRPRRAA